MFPVGMQAPLVVAVQPWKLAVAKVVKWQRMLPDAKNQTQDNVNSGWDVVYCDGSPKQTAGLSHA